MKKLKWGETPFDRMSHADLLLMAKRMYSAITSARSVIRIHKAQDPESIYWTSRRCTGGCALDKLDQIVEPLEKKYGSEEIYRSFYRTAEELLWNQGNFTHGFGWAVCPKCGVMLGSKLDGEGDRISPNEYIGKKCSDCHPFEPKCDGIFEKLEWKHLAIATNKK